MVPFPLGLRLSRGIPRRCAPRQGSPGPGSQSPDRSTRLAKFVQEGAEGGDGLGLVVSGLPKGAEADEPSW